MDADQNDATLHLWSRLRTLAMLGLVVIVTACGPFDDEEREPTSTPASLAQPTESQTVSEATDPGNGTAEAADVPANRGTPEPDQPAPTEPEGSTPAAVINILRGMTDSTSTPVSDEPESSPSSPGAEPVAATPDDQDPAGPASDESPDEPTPSQLESTQESADSTTAVFSGSDGTSGATPANALDSEADDELATPGSTPPLAVPDDDPEGSGVDFATIDPFLVTSCDPTDVPILVDGGVPFITVVDVNIRSGPGTDCESIGDGPLGVNIALDVLTVPVEREDRDDPVWVQVQINETIGWVVLEALEPEG